MVRAPPLEEVRTFVERVVTSGLVQIFAVEDGAVVGWCDVLPRRSPGQEHVGAVGMGVLASHRGRGLGRRLMEAMLEGAERTGLTRVELEVWASNVAAIRLYRAMGFEVEGRRRSARFLDDSWDDLVIMARLTGPAAAAHAAGDPPRT